MGQSMLENVPAGMQRVPICGVPHTVVDYDQALSVFHQWIINRASGNRQVCISNVHTTIMCQNDLELNAATQQAAMVTMDGQPLKWYANLVHAAGLSNRVCGPELMRRTLAHGLDKGWRHYFLGGKPEVLEQLCLKLKSEYPGLAIAGSFSPPFRTLAGQEEREIVEQINTSHADFLWVGLGAPKQEKWIARNINHTLVPVQIGVGAAFDFLSGAIKRAPKYLQDLGLEWAYRIAQDPRLLKRYLITNPVFMVLFCYALINKRMNAGTGIR